MNAQAARAGDDVGQDGDDGSQDEEMDAMAG